MNKQFSRQLEVCHMTLERAIQGVSHMKQLSQLPQNKPNKKHDPAMDLFMDSLVLSQSKVKTATIQLKDLHIGFGELVKSHDKRR